MRARDSGDHLTGGFGFAFGLAALVNVLGLAGWVLVLPEVRPLDCDYCDLKPACRLVALPTDPDENGGEVPRA